MKNKIQSYCNFDDPSLCYILLLLSRKKDNPNQVENEKLKRCHRRVITSVKEMEDAIDDFEKIVNENKDINYRVYVSVNRRSLLKGLQSLQYEINTMLFDIINGNKERFKTISRIDSEWKSQLAGKNCRAEKLFLLDIDLDNKKIENIDNFLTIVNSLSDITEIKYDGTTKNGFVIVCKPCNPADLWKCIPPECVKYVEVKPDDYLYIGEFNQKDPNFTVYDKNISEEASKKISKILKKHNFKFNKALSEYYKNTTTPTYSLLIDKEYNEELLEVIVSIVTFYNKFEYVMYVRNETGDIVFRVNPLIHGHRPTSDIDRFIYDLDLALSHYLKKLLEKEHK